jgi:DNA-binding MarR family transcriptional regulator
MVEMTPVLGDSRIGILVEKHNAQRANLAYELVITLPSYGRWVSSIWNSETPFGQVSHRQVTILWILRKRHFMQGLTPTASNFAELLSVRKSVITRVLASLEAGGFISRVNLPDDARSQLIELTERGHDLSVYIEEIFMKEMVGSIDFVSDDQIEQLLQVIPLLQRISVNLEQARKQRVALMGGDPYGETPG